MNPTATTGDDLFTLAEAAARLRVSERLLRNEHARGELRLVKIGRRKLVPASEVARILTGFQAAKT